MPAPRFLGYQALLGEPKPINWQGVGQALWDSNLNAPIRGAYNLMNADPYTLYTDTGAAGQQAAMDSFDAAGGVTVGSMPIPKPANSLTMGIKAYHGSPHSFDKFSMDKIGTGEGAQAYGHGLYFAENEGVAKGYRDQITGSAVTGAQRELKKAGGDVDGAIAAVQAEIDRLKNLSLNENTGAGKRDQMMQFKTEHLTELMRLKDTGQMNPGSMYEVNIDADPNAFLDWDKPLSEQPEVQSRLATIGEASRSSTTKGVDKYISLENMLGAIDWPDNADAAVRAQYRKGAAARVSEKLKEAGIPGIKYLDAGSRNGNKVAQIEKQLAPWKARLEQNPNDAYVRQEVEGLQKDLAAEIAKPQSRNYVVFDDKLISIVKKYGIAGASAMLGYDVLTGANEAQAKAVNKADLDHRYDNFLKSGGI
jgi:hypothetical protein